MYLMAIYTMMQVVFSTTPPHTHTMLKYQKPSFGDSSSTYIKPETQNIA